MARKRKEQPSIVAAEQAQVESDPRDEKVAESTADEAKKGDDEKLVAWIVDHVSKWKQHRNANYMQPWDMYERLWRAIYSDEERTKKRERSTIISPALSEAVESAAAEIEEAAFGRGDFFALFPEASDTEVDRAILTRNEALFREDLSRSDFAAQCGEVILNSAVYGTGAAEIVMVKKTYREISAEIVVDPATQQEKMSARITETEKDCPQLLSVNPRNLIIDPAARDIESALGVAIEEDVGTHILRAGVASGDYNDVAFEAAAGDVDTKPDPQGENPWTDDVTPVIRYYGKVPRNLLFPPAKTEELFPDEPEEGTDPKDADMIEAWVVIANEQHLLKAIETPEMMKDRPVIAYQWDVVPGKFYGRGICEKGATSQKLLDAELRSRIDALAFVAAPMIAMDAAKLPRGFKFDVYPGKNLLLSGDPSTIIKPFKFGELDANSAAQVQMLDQMVQRATGSLDTAGLARSGVGGDARSGAVSMALAPIVKRNKRTLMRYIDRFLAPTLRKMFWRYMQYDTERYTPVNAVFNVSSTMGIMQREYESANLAQMLGSMQPGTTEHMAILMGIVQNSGIPNREGVMAELKAKLEKVKQAESIPPVDPNMSMDPVAINMQRMAAQLDLAKTAAEVSRLRAQARLYDAQARTEAVAPTLEAQKIALKGIYKTPEEQIDEEFDRRMQVAELKLKTAQMNSDEHIADKQIVAAHVANQPKVEMVSVPEPVAIPTPVPMPGAENL